MRVRVVTDPFYFLRGDRGYSGKAELAEICYAEEY